LCDFRGKQLGFTIIELVAVLVLVGLLGATASSRLFSPSTFGLQASRDQVVSAFRSAQQLAMTQGLDVRFSSSAGSIDIRQDNNSDSIYGATESVRIDGVQYPFDFNTSQSLTISQFDFTTGLGRTSAGSITISQDGASVVVSVSSAGFVE